MVGLIIVQIMLGLASLLFATIWYNRASARYRNATQLWHRGEATILAASYQKTVQRTGQGTFTSYQPRVQYSFGAAGERSGDRAFLNTRQNLGSLRKAEDWVARYPVGGKVPVWWDPANPTDSTLELNRPAKSVAIVFTLLGVFLLMLGCYIAAKTMFHH